MGEVGEGEHLACTWPPDNVFADQCCCSWPAAARCLVLSPTRFAPPLRRPPLSVRPSVHITPLTHLTTPPPTAAVAAFYRTLGPPLPLLSRRLPRAMPPPPPCISRTPTALPLHFFHCISVVGQRWARERFCCCRLRLLDTILLL